MPINSVTCESDVNPLICFTTIHTPIQQNALTQNCVKITIFFNVSISPNLKMSFVRSHRLHIRQ